MVACWETMLGRDWLYIFMCFMLANGPVEAYMRRSKVDHVGNTYSRSWSWSKAWRLYKSHLVTISLHVHHAPKWPVPVYFYFTQVVSICWWLKAAEMNLPKSCVHSIVFRATLKSWKLNQCACAKFLIESSCKVILVTLMTCLMFM